MKSAVDSTTSSSLTNPHLSDPSVKLTYVDLKLLYVDLVDLNLGF